MPHDGHRRVLVALAAAIAPIVGGSGLGDSGETGHSGTAECEGLPAEICFPWAAEVQGDCPPSLPEPDTTCVASDVSRPVWADGACCYTVGSWSPEVWTTVGCGRAFLVESEPRAATPGRVRGWAARGLRPDLSGLDGEDRRLLAGFWASIAANEHASIASFHRAALECLAIGAPARFLTALHRAARDEVRHARQAFALASAFAGASVGPQPLELVAPMPLATTREEVALRTVREACVVESLSLAAAMRMAEGATDPTVKRVLDGIVRDETRHVKLAWQLARWLLRDGASAAVREAFTEVPDTPSAPPLPPRLERWGCVGNDVLAPLTRAAHARVVAPSGARLCA